MASGGFDYEFTPELPDVFICVVCHLALKKPKQIEECGHRFCDSCFDDMKDHVTEGNQMQCPVDRHIIAEDKVFKDTATERMILSWKVKCENQQMGCDWIGELNTILKHVEECNFKSKEGSISQDITANIRKYLCELEEKNEEEIVKINNRIDELVESHQELKNAINQLKNKISSKINNLSVAGPNDLRTLTVLSDSKWEWKCPVFHEREVLQESPLFYHQKWCFQLLMKCERDDYAENKLVLYLRRCRGIFDHPEKYLVNDFPKDCTFQLSMKSTHGNIDMTQLDDNPWIIEKGRKISVGPGKFFRDGFYYMVNGFYHVICEKIEFEARNGPQQKRLKN